MGRLAAFTAVTVLAVTGWAQPQRSIAAPFRLAEFYFPSGFMGDGAEGTKHVQMRQASPPKPRHQEPEDNGLLSTQFSYQPGPKGWAGVYWLSPSNNWGEQPGNKILGACRITFWAAGHNGGEVVEFRVGGLGKRYRDSTERSTGVKTLTPEWTQYWIPLRDQDLSGVLGGFMWLARAADQKGTLTFYVDHIRYETECGPPKPPTPATGHTP